MTTKYKPEDPILLGLQDDQVSWSEHYPNCIYGRGIQENRRVKGKHSPGEYRDQKAGVK